MPSKHSGEEILEFLDAGGDGFLQCEHDTPNADGAPAGNFRNILRSDVYWSFEIHRLENEYHITMWGRDADQSLEITDDELKWIIDVTAEWIVLID